LGGPVSRLQNPAAKALQAVRLESKRNQRQEKSRKIHADDVDLTPICHRAGWEDDRNLQGK
jgi:hypothetical protein